MLDAGDVHRSQALPREQCCAAATLSGPICPFPPCPGRPAVQALRKALDRGAQAWRHKLASSARFGRATENRMQSYALTFAGCAICSLIFVYDTTPSVLKVGKIAVAVFTALFVVTEIVALVR